MTKIVIIGGVAGGATAAARLRRLDESAEIILFERGDYISYANCGLPYYVGQVITDRARLFVMTPELFRSTLNVDVRTQNEVVAIDTQKKMVKVRDRKSEREYFESYDSLVLSPGAEPIRPNIPGIDLPRVFSIRSVPDTDKVKEFIDATRPQRAVVIGGGFIGLEMAENLKARGIFVTVVEALPQVMAGIDFEMAALVHSHFAAKKVELYLNAKVTSIRQGAERLEVDLATGKVLPCDLVILAIGVKPESALAVNAGIAVDERKYIKVDEYMQTSEPNIYAVGDAIAVLNPLLNKHIPVPLAGPANKQARIVANNIVQGPKTVKYTGAIGTAIAKIFDLTVACTGLNEKVCVREGIPHFSVIVHPSSHAGYYPEAKPLSLKVIFHKDSGRVLGAQAIGYDGVDKRIDVLAAMIGMGATYQHLQEFEHAYAPPFASAKDAVNHAGFIAANILQGLSQQIAWNQVADIVKEGAYLLDVRTPEEFALGHIEGAANISNLALRNRLKEVPIDRTILVYCGVGIRGYLAERILRRNGFSQVVNLAGGFKTYEVAMAPQSVEDLYRQHTMNSQPITQNPLPFSDGSGMPQPLANVTKDVITVDACGLQCPGPIMQLKTAMDKAMPGTRLLVRATDHGFIKDAQAWCNLTSNLLVSIEERAGVIEAVIEKTPPQLSANLAMTMAKNSMQFIGKEASLIVFSNDLDRALASFVIANGAAATGKKVTMFFTFWGLSVIRRKAVQPVHKDFMGRMFDFILPQSANKLALSKMNMGGAGSMLMKRRMTAKSVDQLEVMMDAALKSGVRMVACLMSMDLMGVAREELMDGVEIGGVATYLEAASSANLNLFI